ncbi:MAG: exodeoxyribonuclease V subunit alpha [Actinomycetota bacterium]
MTKLSSARIHIAPEVAWLAEFVNVDERRPLLEAVDVHLAAWVARAAAVDQPAVHLATAMASWAARHGHACADLTRIAQVVTDETTDQAADDAAADTPAANGSTAAGGTPVPDTLPWPEPHDWLAALHAAPATVVRQVDQFDSPPVLTAEPLVLHGSRVYLQRYWFDECTVAASIRARACAIHLPLSGTAATALDALLPVDGRGEPNLQRRAADVVLRNRLSLIVGGPGTGKTHSVARLLAVMLQQQPSLRVALAAPTGKAAARLQESITNAVRELDDAHLVPPSVSAALAELRPSTIHRLLGSKGGQRQRFRHDAANPLPFDMVVIDETSMVSLPLLARLVDAVKAESQLVLIGDPDQLESVELGAVLGDLATAAESPDSPLHGHVVRLLRGHRFGGGSPIALLADGLRRGSVPDTLAQLHSHEGSVQFLETDDPLSVVAQVKAVVQPKLQQVRQLAAAGDAEAAFDAALQVRMLCAHRLGRFGVSVWNELGERWLRGESVGKVGTGSWYAGRPLLVTRNDARLGLANGDTGVIVLNDGRLRAMFRTAIGVQYFDSFQLAEVDTAYAMTVHKSQGSEYPTVVMILPPANSPLVGRELLYTGATRASRQLVVVGTEASVVAALGRPATRMTGLGLALDVP